MKTFLFILLIYYASGEDYPAPKFNEGEVNFCIFSTQPRNVSYTDFMVLPEAGFNKDLPTVFVIHGFQSGYDFLDLFREAYGTDLTTKLNLIGIDWSKGSSTWIYPTAVARTPIVGNAVGKFIMSSIQNNLISDPLSIHVVGHSLGAHIAGFVGKHMASSGNPIKLQHITALDPAGPYIGSYDCPNRLCDTDAFFVETIHTNGGVLGRWLPIGQLDIYLNGGSSQPGCWLPPCSHSFSHEWYRTVLHGKETDGWLCNDLDQMQAEKFCKREGNPRKYDFEIIEKEQRELGVVYMATVAFRDYFTRWSEIGTVKTDDYTIVFFGPNSNKVVTLVSLLSDDGHLVIQKHGDEIAVLNPANNAWRPDPKFIICDEVQPERIRNFLSDLKKPFRFVVAFDSSDMFLDPFWEMLYYLTEYQKFGTFVLRDEIYPNQLQMVTMDVPHDGIRLQQHTDALKLAIKNGLQNHYTADFQMTGMHIIARSGPLMEMSELEAELADIKNVIVSGATSRERGGSTLLNYRLH